MVPSAWRCSRAGSTSASSTTSRGIPRPRTPRRTRCPRPTAAPLRQEHRRSRVCLRSTTWRPRLRSRTRRRTKVRCRIRPAIHTSLASIRSSTRHRRSRGNTRCRCNINRLVVWLSFSRLAHRCPPPLIDRSYLLTTKVQVHRALSGRT